MKKQNSCLPGLSVFLLLALLFPAAAQAHFGMLIPSKAMLMEKAKIALNIAFAHPFAQEGMNMAKPAEAFVFVDGKKTSLAESLQAVKYLGHDAWRAEYEIKRPGVYQFATIPQAYFEPAEDCFIIHCVKTVVAALGQEEGWDAPLNLPAEIIPLSRPFGNYAGNVFTGLVLKNGRPAPGVMVEVECLNAEGRHVAPNPYFETQSVKTDANGIFTFGIPWPGWWGFAALLEGDEKISRDGQAKNVELGAVIWAEFVEAASKK